METQCPPLALWSHRTQRPPNQTAAAEPVVDPKASEEETASADETASSAQPDPDPTPPPDNLVQRPIVFDEERVELTLQYLQAHSDPEIDLEDPIGTLMEPHVVVLHWTVTPTADSAWQMSGYCRTGMPGGGIGYPPATCGIAGGAP